MTLPEIYERIAALPTGGYITVDSRLNKGYVYSLIHSARAFIVGERWKQFGKIPPIYYQPFTPEYNGYSQDSGMCYTKFYNVPDIIALDGRSSGLGFVGGEGTICQFREISSRSAWASFKAHRTASHTDKAYVLFSQSGECEVWSKQPIENMTFNAIFSDPTQVNTFNVDFDSYPMDVSDIPKMETYLLQGSMGLVYKTPIDRVNDQRDTTVAPLPKI
jgi:hypothetical protein